MSAADWRRVIDINLTGTFLMIHAMLPLMKTSGWGRIINFSSGSVFSGGSRADALCGRQGRPHWPLTLTGS